jgi:REP element-mobilizing transposase RayT
MSDNKFQNQYRIPSARAQWHGYDGGAYFITICTQHREHYFGEIVNGKMQLSAMGQCVTENLQNVTAHYPYAEIPIYMVMPNHLHAVVVIDGDKIPMDNRRDAARRVSTGYGDRKQATQSEFTRAHQVPVAIRIIDPCHRRPVLCFQR